MITSTFSAQDAQILVALAERAPLQNMQHAKEAGDVIHRFVMWFNETQPKPELPAPKGKAK